jgi:serine/threonine-protein kinase RsbW
LGRTLKVRIESLDGTALVLPEGRLDFGAAAGFHAQLEAVLAGAGKAPAAVLIDCTALDYVSSAGLRIFLQAARAAQRAGTSFALCALQPAVREVFELSGFNRIITVHAERAAALARGVPGALSQQRRMSVSSHATHLPALTRFLQEFWSAAALPPPEALAFELALEEVFMNVVMHGSALATPQVEVSLVLNDADLTMTVEDDGPQFDPLLLPAPDVSSRLEERRVGGNGVFLVRKLMDSVGYQRVGARNQLTMTKHIPR